MEQKIVKGSYLRGTKKIDVCLIGEPFKDCDCDKNLIIGSFVDEEGKTNYSLFEVDGNYVLAEGWYDCEVCDLSPEYLLAAEKVGLKYIDNEEGYVELVKK